MLTKKRIIVIASIIIIVAVIILIKEKFIKNTATNIPTTIEIGWVGPLTGDAAAYGEVIKNSVDMAIAEINTQGGIDNHLLHITYADGKCNGQDAVNALNFLMARNISVILGGTCSGEMLAMAPIAQANHVLLISPSATSPTITTAGDYIFRTIPSDADGGRQLAAAVAKKFPTAAIISEQTDYNQTLKDTFLSEFNKLGGQIVADENYPLDNTDFRASLTKIKSANAPAIIINSQTAATAARIIKQMWELKLSPSIFGAMALGDKTIVDLSPSYFSQATVVDAPGLNRSNPQVNEFLNSYQNRFGQYNYEVYMAGAYDDVNILAGAIKSVGTDAEKIKNYLYQIPQYSGLLGNYHFDTNGDVVGIDFVVKHIINGVIN